ncbi:MAG: hypothetical protein M3237_01550 [Actinomycetota bacterium]|nr:hypothetical protein [Actinomycetota bacterium]
MNRRRLTSVLAALTTAGALAMAPQQAAADPLVLPDILDLVPIDSDDMLTCTQLVPHTISVSTTPVRLDVRILLDGVRRAEAERGVVAMRKAYAPLRIGVVPTYREVRFRGTDAGGLTRQAKRLYGGKRPRGTDVVYTLTSKNITSGGNSGVAGMADCIGGVRFPSRAFAVGEDFGPNSGLRQGTGKTMAHEVGHLLGGHHHYTSPEGLLASTEPNVLDLMAPYLDLCALRFSTLNSLMVRGHAQRYAR